MKNLGEVKKQEANDRIQWLKEIHAEWLKKQDTIDYDDLMVDDDIDCYETPDFIKFTY